MIAALARGLGGALCVLALAGCGQQPSASSLPPLNVTSPVASDTQGIGARTSPPADSSPRISIAKIDASSTLVPLGLNPDRTVEVPPVSRPEQAGVYANGPTPGDPGPAVILGHVNGGGRPGIFARLSELAPGDDVAVVRPDGRTATFRVYRKDTVAKDDFPTSAVYSDTTGAELRLITCGGDLDLATHSYRSNVLVFASLTDLR